MFALTFGILHQASFPVNIVISALTGLVGTQTFLVDHRQARAVHRYDKTLMAEFSASAGRSANSAVAKRVIMADVARLAGVSQQTVSRVVNDSPKLRPETRRRVQAAVERLGYRPNVAAQDSCPRKDELNRAHQHRLQPFWAFHNPAQHRGCRA